MDWCRPKMSATWPQKGMKAAEVRLKAEMIQLNWATSPARGSVGHRGTSEGGTACTEIRGYPREGAGDAGARRQYPLYRHQPRRATDRVTSKACRAKGKIRPAMTLHLYLLAALLSSLQDVHLPSASRRTDGVVPAGVWSGVPLCWDESLLRTSSLCWSLSSWAWCAHGGRGEVDFFQRFGRRVTIVGSSEGGGEGRRRERGDGAKKGGNRGGEGARPGRKCGLHGGQPGVLVRQA